MDFNDTKEEADFRLEVKSWLKENEKVKRSAVDMMRLMFRKMHYLGLEIGKLKKPKLVMRQLHGQKSLVVLEVQRFSQLFILKKKLNIMFLQAFLKLG